MSESDEEIWTQNTFSGVLFSSIELNEILCNRAQQFCFEKESEKEFQYEPNEQKSSKRGVVAVN